MRLRSVAIALAFCVSLLSTSYAQQIPKARQQRLTALAKQLNLTRKQAKRLYPIMQAQEPQLRAIRNDASNPQVKAILTPAQFQQLQAIRQQRRAQLLTEAKSQSHRGGAARSAH